MADHLVNHDPKHLVQVKNPRGKLSFKIPYLLGGVLCRSITYPFSVLFQLRFPQFSSLCCHRSHPLHQSNFLYISKALSLISTAWNNLPLPIHCWPLEKRQRRVFYRPDLQRGACFPLTILFIAVHAVIYWNFVQIHQEYSHLLQLGWQLWHTFHLRYMRSQPGVY